MPTEADPLERIVVKTVSPDHSVAVKLTATDTTVELDPRLLERHTDSSLGAQIGQTVSKAMAGGRRAMSMLAERERGGAPRSGPETKSGKRRERFDAEVGALKSTAASGPVTVTLRGQQDVTVELRPRTVGYQGAEELAGHVNSALTEAKRAQLTPLVDIYLRVFGGDASATTEGR